MYILIIVIKLHFENQILNDKIETVTVYTVPIFKMLSQAISAVRETNNVYSFKLLNVISSDVYIYIKINHTHMFI